ncbi:hypothetical protein GCM10009800_52740 [Nocardiopsis rhodophaea]
MLVPLSRGLMLHRAARGAGLFATSYPPLIVSRSVFGVVAAALFTGTTVALLPLSAGPKRDRARGKRDRAIGRRSAANSVGDLFWSSLGSAIGGLSWNAPFGLQVVGLYP